MNTMKQTNSLKRESLLKRGLLSALFLLLSSLTLCRGQLIEDLGGYENTDTEPAYGSDPAYGITSARSRIITRHMLTASGTSRQETVSYFDGLGRPVQTVLKGITPDGSDLADFTDYDSGGDVRRQWTATASPVRLSGSSAIPIRTTGSTA